MERPDDCTCRQVLVNRAGTVMVHPYYACPHASPTGRVPCVECGTIGPWTMQPCSRCRRDREVRRERYAERQRSNARIVEVGERAARGEVGAATDDEFDGL
jgi:hypothetical protein